MDKFILRKQLWLRVHIVKMYLSTPHRRRRKANNKKPFLQHLDKHDLIKNY